MLFVVMVLLAPFLPFTLGMSGSPLTCMAFLKLFFDSLDILKDFTRQVVVSRREAGVRKWTNWLRGLGSRLYAWFRPDFVPRLPFLMSKDPQSQVSRILVEPHLIDAELRKAWMPFFCRSGHPVVTVWCSLIWWVIFCLRIRFLDSLRLRVGICKKSLLLVVSMVGLGMRFRLFHFPGSLVWLLELVESTGVWPQGLLDA